MILEFVVPGDAVAQPRARAGIRWLGRKKCVPYLYECESDHPVLEFKRTVAATAKDITGINVMECGLGIDLTFVRSLPKSMVRKRLVTPRTVFDGKPDIDNLAKSVLDAMLGIIYADDGQIFGLRATKWYAAGGENAHTKITIYTTVEEFFGAKNIQDVPGL